MALAQTGRRISTGSVSDSRYPLFDDYLHRFGAVAGLFDYSPFDPLSYRRRAQELESFEGDRVALAGLLEDSNRSLGAPPEALASARRLAEAGTLVVIGGQQPGVLTGPLYTFWKAAAVVQLAGAVRDLLPAGATVVPVFWIGAEDHDLPEVASVHVLTSEGTVARFAYDPAGDDGAGGARPRPPVRTSVGYLPTGQAAQSLLDRLEPALWRTEFTGEVMAHLRSTAMASANLGDWFGRLLLGLFGHKGLVVANPLHPGLRALESSILRRMITGNAVVARLFAEGQARVRELGYEPQVEKDPASANLYLYHGTERVPLYRVGPEDRVAEPSAGEVAGDGAGEVAGDGAGEVAGDGAGEVAGDGTGEVVETGASGAAAAGVSGVPARATATAPKTARFRVGSEPNAPSLSETELLDIATRTPERFSTNVVLRPLAQDSVFPVLAYVGGPGETSYFALYGGIYHHFGRRLPVIYPRPNVTLIEPAVGRHLDKCGLTPERALDLDGLRRAKAGRLDEADPVGIDGVFDRLTGTVREAYGGVSEALAAVDPGLIDLAAKNLARVTIEIDWLRNKARQQHRQNCRDAVRRFEMIEVSLRPLGDYQERVFNIFAYLAKYGPAFGQVLADLPLVPADASVVTAHRFAWL